MSRPSLWLPWLGESGPEDWSAIGDSLCVVHLTYIDGWACLFVVVVFIISRAAARARVTLQTRAGHNLGVQI